MGQVVVLPFRHPRPESPPHGRTGIADEDNRPRRERCSVILPRTEGTANEKAGAAKRFVD